MSTNRVLIFLADAESSALRRAKRRQAAIVRLLESLEQAASVPRAFAGCDFCDEHGDDDLTIEFFSPTVEELATKPDAEVHLRWYVRDADSYCIPLTELTDLPAVLVEQMREFASRVMRAADQVEALEGGAA